VVIVANHYTAVLEIQRVDEPSPVVGRDYTTKTDTALQGRQVREVAKIVIRATDLEGLVVKLAEHVKLVDDE